MNGGSIDTEDEHLLWGSVLLDYRAKGLTKRE
jgi:hypothetical protein